MTIQDVVLQLPSGTLYLRDSQFVGNHTNQKIPCQFEFSIPGALTAQERFKIFQSIHQSLYSKIQGETAHIYLRIVGGGGCVSKQKGPNLDEALSEMISSKEKSKSDETLSEMIDLVQEIQQLRDTTDDIKKEKKPSFETFLHLVQNPFWKSEMDLEGMLFSNLFSKCLQSLPPNQEGLKSCRKAIELQEKMYGDTATPSLIYSYNDAGCFLQGIGFSQHAYNYYEKAIQLLKEKGGKEDQNTAAIHNNKGVCLSDMGKYAHALTEHQKALTIYQKTCPNIETLAAQQTYAEYLANVGTCFLDLGDSGAGLERLEEVLKIRRSIFLGPHPEIAITLNQIGNCFLSSGRHEKALEYYQEALKIQNCSRLTSGIDLAHTYNNIGICMAQKKVFLEAIESHTKAINILRKEFGEKYHPEVAESLKNLAVVYCLSGKYKQSLALYEEALAIQKNFFSELHPDFADTLHKKAFVLFYLQAYKDALECLVESAKHYASFYKGGHHSLSKVFQTAQSQICSVPNDCQGRWINSCVDELLYIASQNGFYDEESPEMRGLKKLGIFKAGH